LKRFLSPHDLYPLVSHGQEKDGEATYGALVTRIFNHLKIDYFEALPIVIPNVEIGKKTLDKIMLRMTLEGWVNR